ncbi:MAG: c-type cytochrome [Betaproteobacteria bacterium]|nr:MAG: c-type cytochrome [Betaproteobacteria bacterium]
MKVTFSGLIILAFGTAAVAAGDVKRGAQLFGQCMACHSTTPGEHLTGPSLAQVFNRKAASAAQLVPGTSMTFPGIKETQARQDVIAYLKAVEENKAPKPAQGGGMMGMAPKRPDLKKAPAAAQVRSIKYCGDTYTIETADGKSEKMWEFNLRFKTDSSSLGPAPGKPVALGAGMQGDRGSIIFASPKEISETIRQQCP